ncbi:MAG: Pectinesterase [Gemmatimonadetes bacterium]|nr:Pectinesterase [Gemmatimonadota bacterium]
MRVSGHTIPSRVLTCLLLLLAAAGCTPSQPITTPAPRSRYDAVVDAKYFGHDGDIVNGAHTYHTIAASLDAAPEAAVRPFIIYVRNGRYREKLSVDKPMITLLGESRDSTVLTFDATADSPQPGGGTLGTRGSFTVRVAAPDFRAEHLTIENAFNFLANAKKAATDPTKVKNTQAVALHLDRGSDRAAFVDCVFSGWQDTVYANAGRAYFHDSIIYGNTDFIFGAGVAVFDDCDIISRAGGFIAAPSTPPLQRYGLVFVRSHLRRETNLVKVGTVFLGRPWHPSSNPDVNPSAVYIDCDMDDHIATTGWTSMGGYEPLQARMFEYRSHGVGSVADPIRRILTEDEAQHYAIRDVLGGWQP